MEFLMSFGAIEGVYQMAVPILPIIMALTSLGGLTSQFFGGREAEKARKKQEEEARKQRAIQIANYMGDQFGKSHYGIGSWL